MMVFGTSIAFSHMGRSSVNFFVIFKKQNLIFLFPCTCFSIFEITDFFFQHLSLNSYIGASSAYCSETVWHVSALVCISDLQEHAVLTEL